MMSDHNGQSGVEGFELRALLAETRVDQLALTRVPLLRSDSSLNEAAEEMRLVSHGSALVCENGQLVGILTERDLLRLLDECADFDSDVSESMTYDPQTVTSDDSLLKAVKLMDHGGYRRVPVVDDAGCPAGIIDVKTVMNYLVDQVSATVHNQASTALLTVRSPEGA